MESDQRWNQKFILQKYHKLPRKCVVEKNESEFTRKQHSTEKRIMTLWVNKFHVLGINYFWSTSVIFDAFKHLKEIFFTWRLTPTFDPLFTRFILVWLESGSEQTWREKIYIHFSGSQIRWNLYFDPLKGIHVVRKGSWKKRGVGKV